MKKRLITIALMICGLSIGAASGQRNEIQEVIVQDDHSGDYLILAVASGAYKFVQCNENSAVQGVGQVEVSGCRVLLKDISVGALAVAEIDLCAGSGKASITIRGPLSSLKSQSPVDAVISDSNIRDSVAECRSVEN